MYRRYQEEEYQRKFLVKDQVWVYLIGVQKLEED